MSKKVCHITTVHPPFDTRIFHKEAKTLAKAGYDVTLIAQHNKDEVVDGIKIIALPKAKNRFHRMTILTFKAFQLALQQKGDIYHFHDPELIPVGLILKLLGKKVIYDVHEDLPRQILSKWWIPKSFRVITGNAMELLEGITALFFEAIVTVTPKIASRFPKNKTVLVQNFPIQDEFVLTEDVAYTSRAPLIAYAGGINVIRGIFEMIRAIELLPKELEARLVLAGTFSPASLKEEVCLLPGWRRVEFLGWQSIQQVKYLLGVSRIGLVTLHSIINYLDSYPVKLFEYMSAAIPVIASDFPLWREIVEGAGCGLLVDPLNPEAIAEAITYLLTHPDEAKNMGLNGRKAIEEKYNWKNEGNKLLELYKRILQG
ncbi:MAG: glycosyltransferase family 4 protein [bacterium]